VIIVDMSTLNKLGLTYAKGLIFQKLKLLQQVKQLVS